MAAKSSKGKRARKSVPMMKISIEEDFLIDFVQCTLEPEER